MKTHDLEKKWRVNTYFDVIKRNSGIGYRRLPMKNNEVDYGQFTRTADIFIENGFDYFSIARIDKVL